MTVEVDSVGQMEQTYSWEMRSLQSTKCVSWDLEDLNREMELFSVDSWIEFQRLASQVPYSTVDPNSFEFLTTLETSTSDHLHGVSPEDQWAAGIPCEPTYYILRARARTAPVDPWTGKVLRASRDSEIFLLPPRGEGHEPSLFL